MAPTNRGSFSRYAPPALPFKPVILPQSNRPTTGLSVWTFDQLECGNVGAFQTLAWPHRLYRMSDRCAVLRTLLQCVCTQRRNCIGQLSPFSEYAPTALRKPATTIKLIHYRRLGAKPHESSAGGGCLGTQCLQRFQSLDATRDWDCRYPAQQAARPLRREPAGFAMPFRSHPTLKFSAEVFPLLGTSS